MKQEILRIENILAREQGIKTLDNFFMNLYKGELLGVFANNATDKRHFIDLICGEIDIERGRICYANKPVDMVKYKIIRRQKISHIQPKSKLVDDLTIASNIFVVRDGFKQQLIHEKTIEMQASLLMEELGFKLKPDLYVYRLTRYEKLMIEITKAFGRGAEIMIFEDLSKYLTDQEINHVKKLILMLRRKGMSILIIDSYSNVLTGITDRVMILQNGRNLWTFEGQAFDKPAVDTLFNQAIKKKRLNEYYTESSDEVICFDKVSTKNVCNLSFKIHGGQILSLFDGDGKGVEDIKAILEGDNHTYKGSITLGAQKFKSKNPWQSVKKKIGFVSENPQELMIFDNLSAIDNLTYAALNKVGNVLFSKQYYKSIIEDYKSYFSHGALLKHTEKLSTYDRHRLAYLKWHLYNPKLVVCIRPFSSVDMALKETTLELMEALLKKGIAILILSSNYEEVSTVGKIIDISSKEYPLSSKE